MTVCVAECSSDKLPTMIPGDELRQKLMNKGVATEVYYPLPIHKQPLYQNLGYNDHLPSSEKAAREALSLPVHPSVTGLELKHIAECLMDCGQKHST